VIEFAQHDHGGIRHRSGIVTADSGGDVPRGPNLSETAISTPRCWIHRTLGDLHGAVYMGCAFLSAFAVVTSPMCVREVNKGRRHSVHTASQFPSAGPGRRYAKSVP
jgi:hypothetical protein